MGNDSPRPSGSGPGPDEGATGATGANGANGTESGARPAPRYGQYAPQPPQYGQQPPQYGQSGSQPPQYGQAGSQPPQYQPGPQPPQYGQPGYGQFGQGPFGQRQPGYGPPTLGPAGPAPQTAVRNASLMLILTAVAEVVIAAITTAVLLSLSDDDLQSMLEQMGGAASGVTFEQLRTVMDTFVWFVLVCVIINAAVLVLCAVFLRRGQRWARTVGTVFLCLTLGSIIGGSVFALITIALAITTIVLLFRPPVTAFLAGKDGFAGPYPPRGPSLGNPYGQ